MLFRAFFAFFLVWRRRKIYFRRRLRILRKWRRRWNIKVKGIKYRIRRSGRRTQLKAFGRWRWVKQMRGIWYINIVTWQRIYIHRGWWTIRRNNRYVRLPRNSRTFRIRLLRKWRPVKCTGRRYYMQFKRRWRLIRRPVRYSITYRGKKLRVKRTRGRYRVRYRGRYGRARKGKAWSNRAVSSGGKLTTFGIK